MQRMNHRKIPSSPPPIIRVGYRNGKLTLTANCFIDLGQSRRGAAIRAAQQPRRARARRQGAFGGNVVLASPLLLDGIGVLSNIIPNIPLVVAMVLLVKEYAIGAGCDAGCDRGRLRTNAGTVLRSFLRCAWAPRCG